MNQNCWCERTTRCPQCGQTITISSELDKQNLLSLIEHLEYERDAWKARALAAEYAISAKATSF